MKNLNNYHHLYHYNDVYMYQHKYSDIHTYYFYSIILVCKYCYFYTISRQKELIQKSAMLLTDYVK